MTRRAKDRRITVNAAGPVGPDAFTALADELRRALDSDAPELVVDLSEAQAIDGGCLSLLIAASIEIAEGRTLSVVASPPIHHAFTDWRLDSVLTLIEQT